MLLSGLLSHVVVARAQKMGSVHTAHIELPMVLMGIDNWGGPAIKEEFLQRLSKIAK
jgi:hypothetical protein